MKYVGSIKEYYGKSVVLGYYAGETQIEGRNPLVLSYCTGERAPNVRIDRNFDYSDLTSGYYIFEGVRVCTAVVNKHKDLLQIVRPLKLICTDDEFEEHTGKSLLHLFYGCGLLHRAMNAVDERYRYSDWDIMHYLMRIFQRKYSWVPTKHGQPFDQEFIQSLIDKIILKEVPLWEIVQIFDEFEAEETNGMKFDPNYDRLHPEYIPVVSSDPNSKYGWLNRKVKLISSDIGSLIENIEIDTDEDLRKYRPYFEKDLVINKYIYQGKTFWTPYYTFPSMGTKEYDEMLRSVATMEMELPEINASIHGYTVRPLPLRLPRIGKLQLFGEETAVFADYLKYIGVYQEGDFQFYDGDFTIDSYYFGSKKPGDKITVKFVKTDKHMDFEGIYTASQIYRKLKGKCLNADISMVGNTLETLRIQITANK